MSRTLRLTFLASILGNVLLAGVILGGLPHGFGPGFFGGPRMERALRDLPEPTQTRLREKLDDERAREQFEQAREAVARTLLSDPFDEAAYDEQVNRIDALRRERGREIAELVKEAARELPLEQRRGLADLLTRGARPQARRAPPAQP